MQIFSMHIFSYVLMFFSILNILLAAIIVFKERRDASSTWAWLLVLVFIPLGGFFLYLMLGQNLNRHRLFHWDDRKKLGLEQMLKKQITHIRDGSFEFSSEPERASQDLIYMQLLNNEAPFTSDNAVDIYTTGGEKFKNLLHDIDQAQNHIHLQYYIIKKDNLGKRIRDALIEKAKQGVKVRVLYDELGSRTLPNNFFADLRKAGGEVEVFFPSKFAFINFRMNYRNHRKIVIIDGKIGYVGGFNIGDEYLGLSPRFGNWRDTHLRIQGKAVLSMQTRFILDWNQASYGHDIDYDPVLYPNEDAKGTVGMQIVTSGPESEWPQIKDGYIKMISMAKKSITIQTPYFIPDASLLDTLRIACHSGVNVNIMIPNKPDHLFVYWASLSNIGGLLKAGANVYIYDNGFIHAKSIVVDDEISSVGTANFDIRSLKLNFEINAFIYNKDVAKQLIDAFQEDVKLSRKLTWEEYQHRSRWIRFRESISRLLSPIL